MKITVKTTIKAIAKVMAFSYLTMSVVGASAVYAQEGVSAVPEPINIDHRADKPTIPEVAADEVIGFTLYTVQDNILKLSAQLYPLKDGQSRRIELQIQNGKKWQTIQERMVDDIGWMATFRVEGWDHTENKNYRVIHVDGASYGGIIRKDPVDKEEIVVAAFTGNSNKDRSTRADIVNNVNAQDPDLLFFSGDQSYDHKNHLAAWLLFGRQFGEIMKDRPTITIPDDHDVGQGNLWGEGGKKSTLHGGADGGYTMPVAYVNQVQRAQTAHMPDPYDPTPVNRGITVYYTDINIGGISFAVLEDRKWKTGPDGVIPKMGPRPDHINDVAYDRASVDVPEAVLLGKRQLDFLEDWGQDWDGVVMKTVLSQTIFAGGAHIHGGNKGRLLADLDSNGWPQAGRNRALHAMRKSFAFHIAGDQHLATVIEHGTQAFNDSGWSFCVPSIVNYYGRWWWPLEAPLAAPMNQVENSLLPFNGRFYDGLGNKVTMHAYANPTKENYNAAGYGIVRFNKNTRKIVMENWPRHQDVTMKGAKQFPGWPVVIDQMDNYGRQAIRYLPTLQVSGTSDPVVQITDEFNNEVVYTVRIKGNAFKPKVFREGTYTIRVGESNNYRLFKGVSTLPKEGKGSLEVVF